MAVVRAWIGAGADLDPDQARAYLSDWGRDGDLGLVLEASGAPVAAAWMRVFPFEAPGLAFVTPGVPEFIFFVDEDHRRQGFGARLVEGLLRLARDKKCPFVSVAVPRGEPGERLVEKLGFADSGLSDENDPIAVHLGCP